MSVQYRLSPHIELKGYRYFALIIKKIAPNNFKLYFFSYMYNVIYTALIRRYIRYNNSVNKLIDPIQITEHNYTDTSSTLETCLTVLLFRLFFFDFQLGVCNNGFKKIVIKGLRRPYNIHKKKHAKLITLVRWNVCGLQGDKYTDHTFEYDIHKGEKRRFITAKSKTLPLPNSELIVVRSIHELPRFNVYARHINTHRTRYVSSQPQPNKIRFPSQPLNK